MTLTSSKEFVVVQECKEKLKVYSSYENWGVRNNIRGG